MTLRPEDRFQVRSDALGPGWHEAGIGRLSLPVSGEECTKISVRGDRKAETGRTVHLLELEAVDAVRIRNGDGGRWTTVESHRLRLPEPRC